MEEARDVIHESFDIRYIVEGIPLWPTAGKRGNPRGDTFMAIRPESEETMTVRELYEVAREQYAKVGVDTDKALEP